MLSYRDLLEYRILHVARLAMLFYSLISLHGSSGWSAPLLFTCNKIKFSYHEPLFLHENIGQAHENIILIKYGMISTQEKICELRKTKAQTSLRIGEV